MKLATTRRGFMQGLVLAPAFGAARLDAAPGPGALLPRRQLELMPGLIHLNTASAGPTPRSVKESAFTAWRLLESDPVPQAYGDVPGTVFSLADAVRAKAATLIGASANEIFMTHGTTDGISTLAASIRLSRGDSVLLSALEHEGGEVGWLHRQREDGIGIDRVPLPLELHDPDRIVAAYVAAITAATKVISVSHVIAATGLVMPIARIAEIARAHKITCIVDGAQAAGQIPIDVRALGCHAYATSGHKWLMGPKGTGFVYIAGNADNAIDPPQWLLSRKVGSNSAGLGPHPITIGLGKAIDDLAALGIERVSKYNLALAAKVFTGMTAIPQLRVVSPAPGAGSAAMIAAVLPDRIDSREVRQRLRDRHQLVIKMAEKRWMNGIRLSPHIFNTEVEIDTALEALRLELNDWR